jgi:hypothetical protein
MSSDAMSHEDLRSYRIIRRLGAGGMGSVYEGRMLLPLGKEFPVAIKLMRADPMAGAGPAGEDALDPGARRRAEMFAREALTSMHLNHDHPNLVTAYDFGASSTGRLFLVMELVHGASVGELARRGAIPAPVLRRIARDALSGLAHLHQHGVIHGDISPGNILVSRDGVVKLADLGLARRVDSTLSGTFRGTAAYASPEALQCAGADASSDLYSLAAVLYELLAGQPPHGADGGPAAIFGKMVERIRAPVPEGAPADLADLLGGLLRFHKDEREPAGARQAVALLERGGEPAAAAMAAIAPIADDDELRAFARARMRNAGTDSTDSDSSDEDAAFADTVLTLRAVAMPGRAVPRQAERTAELEPAERTAELEPAGCTAELEPAGCTAEAVAEERAAGRPARAVRSWRPRPAAWAMALLALIVIAMVYPVLLQLMLGAVAAPSQPAPASGVSTEQPDRLASPAATEQRAPVSVKSTVSVVSPVSVASPVTEQPEHDDRAGAPARRAARAAASRSPARRTTSAPRSRRSAGQAGQEHGPEQAASNHFRPVPESAGIHIVAPPAREATLEVSRETP